MDNNASLTEFFYNIVPGTLFILLLYYFDIIKNDLPSKGSDNEWIFFVFLILVIGLFLGFLFQGITIILRHWIWNERIFRKVSEKNIAFELVSETLLKGNRNDSTYEIIFYLMDTKLRAEERAFLPTHFSSLFAFWSNILCGGSLIILIVFIKELCNPFFESNKVSSLIALFMFTIFAWYLSDKFLKSFYDTITNCYYMLYVKKYHRK